MTTTTNAPVNTTVMTSILPTAQLLLATARQFTRDAEIGEPLDVLRNASLQLIITVKRDAERYVDGPVRNALYALSQGGPDPRSMKTTTQQLYMIQKSAFDAYAQACAKNTR